MRLLRLDFKLLKKPIAETKPLHTIVFVDYESLFISFKRQYSAPPPLDIIMDEVKECGKIARIKFFGDFTDPEMSLERSRIRTITSDIIDCSNEANSLKKDFTDFIMLDHIYREAVQNEPAQQFIIFTGDGHFSSVATFLRMFMDKTVGIYGVSGSLSRQLRDCSSWTKEISVSEDDGIEYRQNLIRNIRSASNKGLILTFMNTVEHTQRNYGGDRYRYEDELRWLIDEGYLSSELCTAYADNEFKMLVVDWERVNSEL